MALVSEDEVVCFCFGRGLCTLKPTKLPTMFDVMRHYFYLYQNGKANSMIIRKMVVENIKKHWKEGKLSKDVILLSDKAISMIK